MKFVYDEKCTDGFYRCDECGSSFRWNTKQKSRHNLGCDSGSRNPSFATHYVFGRFEVVAVSEGCRHGSPLTIDILRDRFPYLLSGSP